MNCSPDLAAAIKRHALECYPNESCGIVIDGEITDQIEGYYLPLENTFEDKRSGFKIERAVYAEYAAQKRITAIVHSHPDAYAAPSAHDMQSQMTTGLPWIIVATNGINCQEPFGFGDQLPMPDLMNRPFRSGVTDCYDAVRHYLLTKADIKLPQIPRSWGWWLEGLDLYEQGLKPYGFRKLPEETEPQPFDCFLVRIRSKVFNHGGVYIGDGMIYHHIGTLEGAFSPSKLPVIEYGHRWLSHNPVLVRHESLDGKC